jgi:ESCRT-II complex subunit VPS36
MTVCDIHRPSISISQPSNRFNQTNYQQQDQRNNTAMDWSPFYCLPKAELTPSGLIQLDTADNEVLLLRRQGVEFRHEGPTPMAPRPRGLPSSERWKNATGFFTSLIITTHRFVLLHRPEGGDGNNTDARFVHLSNVKTVEPKGGPSLMSPNASYKIVLNTQTYDELVLVFRRSGTSCRDDRDTSVREFNRALERKRWEVATRLQEQNSRKYATLDNRVGLDKILAKNKMRHRENAKLAEDALSGDSENLLQEAAGLLKVIQKYKVLVQKFEGETSASGDDEEAANKLKGLLSDMGMTSALSQSKVAGSRNSGFHIGKNANKDKRLRDYHELTARQVADFLVPRLRKRSKTGARGGSGATASGGMMSLTDVYCLFNRARGSNLISPEDLRASCALLGAELKVGLSMRTFPSGVVVLQLDDLALDSTNYEARRALIDLCNCQTGRSALEASHYLKLSPLLAAEQLEEAERLGWLCRDVTLSTTRFYPNKFATTF